MRFVVRLLAAIWIATLLVTVGFAWLEVQDERAALVTDLERRATLAVEAVREASERLVGRHARAGYDRILTRFARADRSVAIYDDLGGLLAASPDVQKDLGVISPLVSEAIRSGNGVRAMRTVGGRPAWVHVVPLSWDDAVVGAAAVLLDARHLESREWSLWGRTAVRFGVLGLLLSGITLVLVRYTVTRPMARMAEWTKQLKTGQPMSPPPNADESLFGSLAQEVDGLARSLARARAAAEQEARLRLAGESIWTEERLKQFVRAQFGDRPIFAVSNREPVSHVRDGRTVRTLRPASGLVTALEPIMAACGGVWVAHGSGDADQEVGERVGLPPEDPLYTLRRVWLDAAEESGYYYGFANEGLWPLCHIVHERPQFRAEDWRQYRAVNRKFAEALLREMEGAEAPIVLVHDYHFALLPELIKEARPDARVALFWHIPWPNFEAFRICPWQNDILLGMLGADLVGFHTQFQCNNFLETVERAIEGRVDWDRFAVVRGHHTTLVMPFPISVATNVDVADGSDRTRLLARLGVDVEFLGVGVDRIDYTKGLPERFRAIRRFFERWPEYRGRVVFVQLASPSRGRIPRYQALGRETEETVREINEAIGERGWVPIVYLERHHDHAEVFAWYRHADFCMVTSLHDGMNLVAKEFVAAQPVGGGGALILSRFAGAAHELRDALLVNPYDVDDVADAIHRAVTMNADERRRRMQRMVRHVTEHNVYRWAALLLAELERMPLALPLLRD
jgi:trehalose-6-phosphate synthase/HAMP domain-containing protein